MRAGRDGHAIAARTVRAKEIEVDELSTIARGWLEREGLLSKAWKPPATEAECGFGWGRGEWVEATEQYAADIACDDRLVASLVEVLKGARSIR